MSRISPLWFLLPVQAFLLFWNIGLLPAWTDELFTLDVVPLSPGEILERLGKDIHPPLYYFQLHAVQRLAGTGTVELYRAISALWGLALTALTDALWVRRWKWTHRWLALSLIALSPCILLYARMARSYTMQAALAVVAVWAARRWLKTPGAPWRMLAPAIAAFTALLYTHYVPGLALLCGFALVAIRRAGWRKTGVFCASVCLLYMPWLGVLAYALSRWRAAPDFSSRYLLTGNAVAEQFVKLGFGWTSLSIGESFPPVSLFLAAALLVLLAASVRGAGALQSPTGIALGVAAVAGYLAVSRWVSYPFTPARLLWLLPFLAMAWTAGFDSIRPGSARFAFFAALMISHAASIGYYFQKRDFLNPGYSAPLQEIAASIAGQAQPGDLVMFDAYNTDGLAIGRHLPEGIRWIVVQERNADEARRLAAAARTVWIVRNTRDISPGKLASRIEQEACLPREETVAELHPYAGWQILAMRLLRIEGPPERFYRVALCRAPG